MPFYCQIELTIAFNDLLIDIGGHRRVSIQWSLPFSFSNFQRVGQKRVFKFFFVLESRWWPLEMKGSPCSNTHKTQTKPENLPGTDTESLVSPGRARVGVVKPIRNRPWAWVSLCFVCRRPPMPHYGSKWRFLFWNRFNKEGFTQES